MYGNMAEAVDQIANDTTKSYDQVKDLDNLKILVSLLCFIDDSSELMNEAQNNGDMDASDEFEADIQNARTAFVRIMNDHKKNCGLNRYYFQLAKDAWVEYGLGTDYVLPLVREFGTEWGK